MSVSESEEINSDRKTSIATETEYESSEDSFQSDSDFDDLDDNPAVESGRVIVDEDEENLGFKKKSWLQTRIKRYSRRFWKTKVGKKLAFL